MPSRRRRADRDGVGVATRQPATRKPPAPKGTGQEAPTKRPRPPPRAASMPCPIDYRAVVCGRSAGVAQPPQPPGNEPHTMAASAHVDRTRRELQRSPHDPQSHRGRSLDRTQLCCFGSCPLAAQTPASPQCPIVCPGRRRRTSHTTADQGRCSRLVVEQRVSLLSK
jgi:hypothetical protein